MNDRYLIEIGGMYAATMDHTARLHVGTTFVTDSIKAMRWHDRKDAEVQADLVAQALPGNAVSVRNARTMTVIKTIFVSGAES